MGAGRPGNKASTGRWLGKISLSNAVEPAPAKYSVQATAPIANAKRAPARSCAPLSLDESIHREHPMAYSCSVGMNFTQAALARNITISATIREPGMGVRGKGAAFELPCPAQYWRDPRR